MEKIVLALLSLGVKFFKLKVGGMRPVDVAVRLMDEGDDGELEHLDRLVAAHLGLEGCELGLKARFVEAECAGGKAREMSHVSDAGTEIVDGNFRSWDELVKIECRHRHIGLKGIGS